MKIILMSTFLSFGFFAFGQNAQDKTIADQVAIRCYYLYSKKKLAEEKPYRVDTMVLDIGSKISKFYDPARLSRDSALLSLMTKSDSEIKSVNVDNSENAKDWSNVPGTASSNTLEGESYQIIKDKQTNNIRVLDYASSFGQRYQYTDEPGKLAWEISDETDTIQSYVCQKATLKFRGRNYTAWFTNEIPASDGPWKFSGLPGLILKIEDNEHLFSFNLIGLIQPKTPLPIRVDDSESLKCTRAEFEKQKKRQGPGIQVNLTGGEMNISPIHGKYEYLSMELE